MRRVRVIASAEGATLRIQLYSDIFELLKDCRNGFTRDIRICSYDESIGTGGIFGVSSEVIREAAGGWICES